MLIEKTFALRNGNELVVKYGFDLAFAERNNQAPYFTITASEYRVFKSGPHKGQRHSEPESCGMQHAKILKAWPAAAPLVRWHLSAPLGGPMHYVANARYWFELHAGISRWSKSDSAADPDPWETFKSHVVWGVCEQDRTDRLPNLPKGCALWRDVEKETLRASVGRQLEEWCLGRLPKLQETFKADVTAAGIEWPEVQLDGKVAS